MFELWIADKRYSSWSLRPWLLMKVLNIRFTEIILEFEKLGSSFDKFRSASPSGKLPCLKVGNHEIWDSLAIIEYLGELHPQIWPSGLVAKSWSRAVMSEMHSGFAALRKACPMDCRLNDSLYANNIFVEKDIERINEIWEYGLDNFGGPWLAGESFGPVDAYFSPILVRAKIYDLQFSDRCQNWIDRMWQLKDLNMWVEEI